MHTYLSIIIQQFLVDCLHFGKYDTSLDNARDLPAGTRIFIPLWLSARLFQRMPLQMELPSVYNRAAQAELKAGSLGIDLASRSPYFYEMGLKIALTFYAKNPSVTNDLAIMLEGALRDRAFLSIATRNASSSNVKDLNLLNYIQLLTELEKKIFLLKETSRRDLVLMRRGQTGQLKASQAVILAKQRKRKLQS